MTICECLGEDERPGGVPTECVLQPESGRVPIVAAGTEGQGVSALLTVFDRYEPSKGLMYDPVDSTLTSCQGSRHASTSRSLSRYARSRPRNLDRAAELFL